MISNKVIENNELFRMVNIHKYFGKVYALKGIDFGIKEGECVGLVGDNGAGKSTLVKIISGYHKQDEGKIYFKGKEVKISSPGDARKLGIETVYQEQALAPGLNVSRNIFMGREITNMFGFLRLNEMDEKSVKVLKSIGLNLNSPNAFVSELSGGQRQGIAIARAVHFEAKIIVLDEPTVAISLKEVQQVINFIKSLKEKNTSVIFIAHNIHHIFMVADRIVVMSHGKVIAEIDTKDSNVAEVTDFIIKKS
jgi:simple sugar transport system ATP-binding protein